MDNHVSRQWPVRSIAECAADEPYATQIGPFGKALTPAEYTPKGVPLLRGVNVNHGRFHDDGYVFIGEETADRLSKFESFPGDVLLVHKGTLGKIAMMPKSRKYRRYIMGNSMLRVRCNPKLLLPEYLYYWLCSDAGQHYLFSRVSQVGVPQIQTPLKTLREARLPVPPIPEQQRIADILGTLDDKIELNRRMNDTLEAMARRLFRSWFVDFDPVHAKAELRGEHPKLSNAELCCRALPNMAPEIAELFSDSFEESTLGPIPKGWTPGFVPDAIEINPSRSVVKGTTVAWLEMSKMPTSSARALSWEHREFKSGTKFINGDTLVARITPCLENGKTGFVDFLSGDEVGAGSTEYIVLRPKPPLPPIFAYLLARTDDFRQHLITNMTGTSGRQRAPADCLNTFPLVTPPKKITACFAEVTGNLFSQMKTIDEESFGLTVTRDRLLPRLLSGEIELVGNGESNEPT